MRAVGYFRERHQKSLAEQNGLFLDFCISNGYDAAATFLDFQNDHTDLPGFRQMTNFVRNQIAHGFLLVVVPDLSSLGGSLTEAARRYFQLSSLGAQVIGMTDGDDAASPLLARWTQHKGGGSLSERVRAAMRRKAVKGEVLGRPPYGYRVGARRRLVIVPEEGSVVRYIFRLYLKDGLGIRRIARRLNDEGLTTRRGGPWSMVTVRDILRNRAYVGTYSRFGVRVPASHAPLISQDDFRCVQERLDERRPHTGERLVLPFLLSGLVYCGYCGNKMIGVTRKQKWTRSDGTKKAAQYRYYQCESRANRSSCDYHTQKAEELEEAVRQALLDSTRLKEPAEPEGYSAPEVEAKIADLKDRIRRLDKRLEQYLDAATSGKMPEERLRSLALSVAGQQLQMEEQLSDAQREAQHLATRSERQRLRWEARARLFHEWPGLPFAERRQLLREFLERVAVRDDGLEAFLKT